MPLRLYNTLTRTKETFAPFDPSHVRMYVCGPTVYDRAHIGNARPLIVFDLLYRLLRHAYGADAVTYVRNLTDVDDKINARAAERGVSIRELTEETTRIFHEDVAALGCLAPDVEPRATEHIVEMRALIERLVARGIAYVAQDHVLFSVSAMDARGQRPGYGSLSRRSLDEMIAGARVEVAPYKREPTDFVLWKPSKQNEPAWESPCGIATPGRPGWHIECSAMSFRHLIEAFAGKVVCDASAKNAFDIHGGGIDLVFPHHENEIAQSCCALDSELMAQVWMHNGFLQVEGEKMSKSLGNFITIRDLLEKQPGDVLRLAMLKTHYRQPIDWTNDSVMEARKELAKWATSVAGALGEAADLQREPGMIDDKVVAHLSDDLNTPTALGELHRVFESASKGRTPWVDFIATARLFGFKNLEKPGFFYEGFTANLFESGARLVAGSEQNKWAEDYRAAVANGLTERAAHLRQSLETSGFRASINEAGVLFITNQTGADTKETFDARIADLISLREHARAQKNWAESDRLRKELDAMGITVKDNKNGTTTWDVKR